MADNAVSTDEASEGPHARVDVHKTHWSLLDTRKGGAAAEEGREGESDDGEGRLHCSGVATECVCWFRSRSQIVVSFGIGQRMVDDGTTQSHL